MVGIDGSDTRHHLGNEVDVAGGGKIALVKVFPDLPDDVGIVLVAVADEYAEVIVLGGAVVLQGGGKVVAPGNGIQHHRQSIRGGLGNQRVHLAPIGAVGRGQVVGSR